MVDKVNVKIVSTILNEVRSILADTLKPESFQINQMHNKDLSQHQLNWPRSFQTSCEAVIKYVSSKNFLPNKALRGNFILTEGKVFFKLLKKTLRLKMNGFLFFMFLSRCSLETFQQNKTNCVLQIWVKIGLTTLHTTRARWGSWLVLKILREVSYPSKASNKFFFFVERPRCCKTKRTDFAC